MSKPQRSPFELSRPLAVDHVPRSGMEQRITAIAEERAGLAKRFGLLDLSRLEADMQVHPAKLDECYDVTGTVSADVVQSCVVTLEPLPVKLTLPVKTLFAPAVQGTLDAEDTDAEAIIHGTIDLGELAAQYLGLGLDPYPRKAGTEFTPLEIGATDEKPVSPFAKLVELKPKK